MLPADPFLAGVHDAVDEPGARPCTRELKGGAPWATTLMRGGSCAD